MPRIKLMNPTQNGRPTEHLENKLRRLIVGHDEAIHQGKDLVKGQNAEDTTVGKRGSGFYAERPNGRRIYSRVGNAD